MYAWTFFFLQLANARAPLQAKIRDMEDEMQHLQDKLGKLTADNEMVIFCSDLNQYSFLLDYMPYIFQYKATVI